MKRFTRKISAVLIAALLFMTVAPNLTYANDDVASQSEAVTESAPVEESTEVSEPAPAEESTPEAAPAEESAPEVEAAPAEESAPEAEVTPAEESAPEVEAAPAEESAPETEVAPAEESAPETEAASAEESTPDNIGGDVTVQSEQIVEGTPYKADEALITPENLTVLLRGLDEGNKKDTMLIIDKYINVVVQQSKPVNITGPTFVDAEKFSVGTPGFDSQHCWAATASNILWTTGYAQQAVNPQTGKHFMSEDEVLAYFTANFTDDPGVPKDGVDWFMEGTSAYTELQKMKAVAHYKDVNSGGLLSNVQASSSMQELWNGRWDISNPNAFKGNPDAINSLLSVCSQGMGVLVKWYENNTISSSAHWMTVVGTIIDEATNNLADKYKAIILANSDNNPVHTESGVNFGATTLGQKLAQKANCVNAYTVYRLEFVPKINGNGAWRLVGFGENANRIAVISHLYSLLDHDKEPQGVQDDINYDYSQLINNTDVQYSTDGILTVSVQDNASQCGPCNTPVAQEDKETITITDGQNTIIIAKEDILSALSEVELDKSENLVNLLEYMNDNKVEIFSRAKGIVSIANGDNYVAYIKTPVAKLTVSVDGIVLPEDAYEIIVLPNGMIKIRIKNSYLKALSIGAHNLQINAEGVDLAISSVVTVSK